MITKLKTKPNSKNQLQYQADEFDNSASFSKFNNETQNKDERCHNFDKIKKDLFGESNEDSNSQSMVFTCIILIRLQKLSVKIYQIMKRKLKPNYEIRYILLFSFEDIFEKNNNSYIL